MHVCIECWEDGRNILHYQWYNVTGIIRLACFPTGVAPHFSLTFTFCWYHAINTTVCCTVQRKCPKSDTIGKYGFMKKLNLYLITSTTAWNWQCSALLLQLLSWLFLRRIQFLEDSNWFSLELNNSSAIP